jgi:GNAT superfamily N-acetyltransferase
LIPSAEELAGFTLERQHPVTREWVDDSVRLAGLVAHHEDPDLLLATDLEIAALRVERFAPGYPPETMLNYWVPAGRDLFAMLSMRYEGGDVTKPFVDATPLSRALETRDLEALASAAHNTFGMHRPRYVRLWSAEPVDAFPGSVRDRRQVAGLIEQLKPVDVPPGLSITPVGNVDHYEDAQRAYDAVDQAHPDHPDQAKLQSRENLQESAEDGRLFNVTVDGEWAGHVAAKIESEEAFGLPAYVVEDLLLAPAYRGRGLGRHLSTLMAQALPKTFPILVGTIHADNNGALQAAISAGRQDIGGWLQVPLTPAAG